LILTYLWRRLWSCFFLFLLLLLYFTLCISASL
jgi:hypothetical protein